MCDFEMCYERLYGKKMSHVSVQIPPTLHRIWVGREMNSHTFHNLLEFQQGLKERKAIYNHILWTDKQTLNTEGINGQLNVLQGAGMTVKTFDEFRSVMNEQIFDQNLSREDNCDVSQLKFISDLMRMVILNFYGGVYMDTDIGIGFETFTQPIYHRCMINYKGRTIPMPLIGSIDAFGKYIGKLPAENIHMNYAIIQHDMYIKLKGNYGWNYFFASVPNNPIILDFMMKLLSGRGQDAQSLSIALIENFTQIYIKLMEESFGYELSIMSAKDKNDFQNKYVTEELFKNAFAPFFLQYCTTASIDKNGEK